MDIRLPWISFGLYFCLLCCNCPASISLPAVNLDGSTNGPLVRAVAWTSVYYNPVASWSGHETQIPANLPTFVRASWPFGAGIAYATDSMGDIYYSPGLNVYVTVSTGSDGTYLSFYNAQGKILQPFGDFPVYGGAVGNDGGTDSEGKISKWVCRFDQCFSIVESDYLSTLAVKVGTGSIGYWGNNPSQGYTRKVRLSCVPSEVLQISDTLDSPNQLHDYVYSVSPGWLQNMEISSSPNSMSAIDLVDGLLYRVFYNAPQYLGTWPAVYWSRPGVIANLQTSPLYGVPYQCFAAVSSGAMARYDEWERLGAFYLSPPFAAWSGVTVDSSGTITALSIPDSRPSTTLSGGGNRRNDDGSDSGIPSVSDSKPRTDYGDLQNWSTNSVPQNVNTSGSASDSDLYALDSTVSDGFSALSVEIESVAGRLISSIEGIELSAPEVTVNVPDITIPDITVPPAEVTVNLPNTMTVDVDGIDAPDVPDFKISEELDSIEDSGDDYELTSAHPDDPVITEVMGMWTDSINLFRSALYIDPIDSSADYDRSYGPDIAYGSGTGEYDGIIPGETQDTGLGWSLDFAKVAPYLNEFPYRKILYNTWSFLVFVKFAADLFSFIASCFGGTGGAA